MAKIVQWEKEAVAKAVEVTKRDEIAVGVEVGVRTGDWIR